MGDDDLAATVLVEVCQKHVARAKTDRDHTGRTKVPSPFPMKTEMVLSCCDPFAFTMS